jgi:methyl-accepting chemotaxis protein
MLRSFQDSLGRRLALGYAVMVLMLATVAGLNAIEFKDMGARLDRIVEVNNPKSELANRLLRHIDEMARRVPSVTILTDLQAVEAEVQALSEAQTSYAATQAQLFEAIRTVDITGEEEELIRRIEEAANTAIPLSLKAATAGQNGAGDVVAEMLTNQIRPAEQAWRGHVAKLVEVVAARNQRAYDMAKDAQQRALWVAGSLVLLGVLLGTLVGWRITRSVKAPIEHAIGVAERIAQGDLSSNVQVQSQDEIGRLLQAVGVMQTRLRALVSEIGQSVESIETASAEVASGNQDLSQRTEMAAASLQQTASAMVQLTSSVHQSNDAAASANQLAGSATSVASRGGAIVGQLVDTMDGITAASRRIADIIGVIDGIAFQTNILALNAAVEAARAGEQGRGFAVVASEVRTLAQRSAVAAKEIKSLIGDSVDRVQAGSQLVSTAGTTMNEVVEGVQRVANIIADITQASSTQSSGISEVNDEVAKLEQTTQQNAALVEESAAAAASLQDQARRLAGVVSNFRLH